MIAHLLGGLGLFLLGMHLSTQALRALAGDSLRRILLRFTGGPVRATISGTLITALVQSSSATTLATIGFVGAGLISFQQSVGIILGANVGTTATAWLIAAVGLKVDIGSLALPIVGVGSLVHLFARGRLAQGGLVVAGFGLIFLGIGLLQQGMAGATTVLTPDHLPRDTLLGRAALVGLGALVTALVHASGAVVAMALTAIAGGHLDLDQAAALVIGANVGTTATALLGAIGGNIAARRASLAHFLFNAITGTVAFVLLPWLTRAVDTLTGGDAALALAAFHTGFNLLGVALLLPLIQPFSRLILAILREPPHTLTRFLDQRVRLLGALAVEAVRRTTIEATGQAAGATADLLQLGPGQEAHEALAEAGQAVEQVRAYLARLRVQDPLSPDEQARHLQTLHALDHLAALVESARRAPGLGGDTPMVDELVHGLRALERWAGEPHLPCPVALVADTARHLHATFRVERATTFERLARGEVDPLAASQRLDGLRWLEQLGHEADRMTMHLGA